MMNHKSLTAAAACVWAAILTAGCQPATRPPAGGGPGTKESAGHDHAGHAHPTTGPHGGELIELGDEDHHAELVHDERGGTVTVYMLDAHAEKGVPIDATELTINLKRDGQAAQFVLAAAPEAGDPPGQASRFASSDAQLSEDLEQEGADAQLVVMINGKQYRGRIAHDHDPHDHDHDQDHEAEPEPAER